MDGSIAPMHGRGCSHGWEGVLPSMGALCSHAWERCSHGHGSDAPIMGAQRSIRDGSGLPHAWEPCSHVMGARAPMSWEQVQNVGEALPWGADMGALLDPLPCMGGGAPMTWEQDGISG